jgi:tol-pal system protein YbgF
MTCPRSICALALIASLAGAAVARAGSSGPEPSGAAILLAQNFQPPGSIPGEPPDESAPAPADDAAALLVRIDRLEDQVRTLNGEIEQLQFDQHKLEDEFQKFQQDVDFRFQDLTRGKNAARLPEKRSDASGAGVSNDALANDDSLSSPAPKHNDAFDPSADPDAPGAPQSLGTLTENPASAGSPEVISGPAAGEGGQGDAALGGADSGAPLQLDNGPSDSQSNPATVAAVTPGAPAAESGADGAAAPSLAPPSNPREDFDLALVSFNNGQFNQAENAFRGFVERHPNDGLTPDAIYYMGESYWQLGRVRDAAQQYLKISTSYPRSPHAPESLLKLGLSLEKLGSRDQACASWAQISRKYPNASQSVRVGAERNMKRDQC